MKAVNLTTHEELADDVTVAQGVVARMKGLLGQKSMRAGAALLIVPCKSVHTFGMRFPLDVLFLDKKGRVTALKEHLLPNRLTPLYIRAARVIEMPAGRIAATRTRIGDEIQIA
ncbi:MAG: DUF192 domain-containing protein [Nitrospiraceae bacterium]|nr:DUF192 domain-containing protein [Nitrospiraceae bacterium]